MREWQREKKDKQTDRIKDRQTEG
jgi:hypothetical protein